VATVADQLDVPWAIAFLPDGRALVSERDTGRVVAVSDNGSVAEVQQLESVAGGEGGLLGLAVSPDYATDGLVYAYYSSSSDNRVVRFRLDGEVEAVLTGIPRASTHNGGRIAFGPDGFLYVGTGDAAQSSRSQDPGSPAGKILRITGDGEAAPDNPEGGNPMYSLGHRNVQGLAWDAQGRLFATEFGANAADEINLITPGGNYGWPEVEGSGGASTYVEPLVTYETSEASPSGAALLKGSALTPWNGDLLVGALRGERLLHVNVEGTEVVGTEPLLDGEYGRLRAVTQAPDGSVWVSTSNTDGRGSPASDDDRILRLTPRVVG
jgi:glucose/arabinose dehydrogenase